ncbi:hypothetical protein ACFL0T_06420 [Candidatus Omnitrophota bacterium]
MLMRLLKRKDAVTLIEVIMTVILVGILFAATIAGAVAVIQFFNREQGRYRAADDASIALAWVKSDAIQASDIAIAGTTLTVTIEDFAAAAPTVETITYAVVGTQLQRTIGANTRTLIDTLDTTQAGVDPIIYTTINPNSNYLTIEIRTLDNTGSTSHQRAGVMLRCRRS